jgi:hypothetical protein
LHPLANRLTKDFEPVMLGQHLRRIIDALPSIIDLRQNPKRGLTRARSSSSIPYPLTLNDF